MTDQSAISKLSLFLLILIAVASFSTLHFLFFAFKPFKSNLQQETYVLIHKGQNPNEITKILVNQGFLSDGKKFIWLGRLLRQWKNIKAGEYKLSPPLSPIELFSILASGVSAAHPITVREGENMYEIAEDLSSKGLSRADEFIRLCKNKKFIASLSYFHNQLPATLEGYLFPDTYFFNRSMPNAEIIRQMVKHFFDFWSKNQEESALALQMSRDQIVTLASIIEKETGAEEERAMISSVFHNRLKKGMKLQSDPTTIYGMWDRFEGKIHKADLLAKNNYNTYYIDALPVGPIANPGKQAIEAALHPVQSSFLYFVSHNDGTHEFSENLEAHNRAVQKFQLDPKAREGKSWRNHVNSHPTESHRPASAVAPEP